jgi:B-cell receptor-associated protein 31
LFGFFRSYANIYFNIFIVVLIVLFLDSIRDVKRYSEVDSNDIDLRNNPSAEAVLHMKLFRAQRNFYIAGFALFLFLVLRRLVVLIAQAAVMQADCEATKRQAESATAAAKRLLEEQDNQSNEEKKENEEISKLRKVVNKSKDELSHANLNLDVMKKQAEATNTEYDRLLKEHAVLQEKMSKLEGSESKKDS